jgi:phosphatidylinositol-3-phosphatase
VRKARLLSFLIVASLSTSCGGGATQNDGTSIQKPQLERNRPTTNPKSEKEPKRVSLPRNIDHIVVVVEENRSYQDIIGNPEAPYINSLAKIGANLSNYHAIEHPSQPNYLDIFSGSNQGVTDDSCPHTFATDNLANQLFHHKLTFQAFSESLPSVGFMGCTAGNANQGYYARKHAPWANFTNIPKNVHLPFSAFPKVYSGLPTVSFVIPNLKHDMHDGTVKEADQWLQQNLGAYIKWLQTHNSLFILTWDEDDNSENNRIPTILVGPMVQPGSYDTNYNHFHLLRTLEDIYGLHPIGKSSNISAFAGLWSLDIKVPLKKSSSLNP